VEENTKESVSQHCVWLCLLIFTPQRQSAAYQISNNSYRTLTGTFYNFTFTFICGLPINDTCT